MSESRPFKEYTHCQAPWQTLFIPVAHLKLSNAREVPPIVKGVGWVAQLALWPEAHVGVGNDSTQQVLELLPEGHHQVCIALQSRATCQRWHCRAQYTAETVSPGYCRERRTCQHSTHTMLHPRRWHSAPTTLKNHVTHCAMYR